MAGTRHTNLAPVFAAILDNIEAQPAMLVRAAAKAEPRRFSGEPPTGFGALDDDRHFEFIEQRANEYAARVGGDARIAQAFEIGQLRSELRIARHKLEILEGRATCPQAGCEFVTMPLGESEVLVEYDTESKAIGDALINGKWVSADDCFHKSVIDGWNDEIGEAS